MGATQWAMMISLFVMASSLSMIMLAEFDTLYEEQQGVPFFAYSETPLTTADASGIGTNKEDFNNTVTSFTTFLRPNDIGFDFGFFQGITFIRMFADFFIYSVYGFPQFLVTGFGMPNLFVIPLTLFINISHLLLLAYVLLGKQF